MPRQLLPRCWCPLPCPGWGWLSRLWGSSAPSFCPQSACSTQKGICLPTPAPWLLASLGPWAHPPEGQTRRPRLHLRAGWSHGAGWVRTGWGAAPPAGGGGLMEGLGLRAGRGRVAVRLGEHLGAWRAAQMQRRLGKGWAGPPWPCRPRWEARLAVGEAGHEGPPAPGPDPPSSPLSTLGLSGATRPHPSQPASAPSSLGHLTVLPLSRHSRGHLPVAVFLTFPAAHSSWLGVTVTGTCPETPSD